jgi:hypothetical protein
LVGLSGWLWLVAGIWAWKHPNRVDASFSRGTDALSLPPWLRQVGAPGLIVVGAGSIVLSVLL